MKRPVVTTTKKSKSAQITKIGAGRLPTGKTDARTASPPRTSKGGTARKMTRGR